LLAITSTIPKPRAETAGETTLSVVHVGNQVGSAVTVHLSIADRGHSSAKRFPQARQLQLQTGCLLLLQLLPAAEMPGEAGHEQGCKAGTKEQAAHHVGHIVAVVAEPAAAPAATGCNYCISVKYNWAQAMRKEVHDHNNYIYCAACHAEQQQPSAAQQHYRSFLAS
jgi:hypothetical protein